MGRRGSVALGQGPDWLRWLPLALAGLGLLLTSGLARGDAYGRYIVAYSLLDRRTPVVDGYLGGLRQATGELAPVAYVGGHYMTLDGPLVGWLMAPLVGLGLGLTALWPGEGWAAALAGLFYPLQLLGIAVTLRRRWPAGRADWLALALLVTLSGLLLLAVIEQRAWLTTLLLLGWLLVAPSWPGRLGRLGHGLVGGLLIGLQPWLALPALVSLLSSWRRPTIGAATPSRATGARLAGWRWLSQADQAWRWLGLGLGWLPVAVWQWLLLGRPWRFAALFPAQSSVGVGWLWPTTTLLVLLLLVGLGSGRRWPAGPVLLAGLAAAALAAWQSSEADAGRLSSLTLTLAVLAPLDWRLTAAEPIGAAGSWLLRLISLLYAPVLLVAELARQLVDGRWHLALSEPPVLALSPLQRLSLLVLLVLVVWLGRRLRRSSRLTLSLLVGLLGLTGWWLMTPTGQAAGPPPSLLPGFSATGAGGMPLVLWRLVDGARLEGERLRLSGATARAESPLVVVRAGERYCAVTSGLGDGRAILRWEDDGHRLIAEQGGSAEGRPLCFAAPLGATGGRLWLVAGERPALVEQASLYADGPRLAPLPDYAVAALAFTFDWESSMGGLIHSKGGSAALEGEGGGAARGEDNRALQVAIERGERMRRGAEVLADLFRPHAIRGTFYSTGYNLLTGNQERRSFAGDPTYRWPRRQNGWANDYWTTQRWYADDPYTSEAEAPAWYFGSLTRRLAAEGHEIESHTFGHLYVRGTAPAELAVDLDEWNRAARALGLPAARSFAFPWRSSNSLRQPHLVELTGRGITSLTRVYQVREEYRFELDEIEEMPGLLIFPDQLLSSTAASGLAARRAIDEVMLRRGYQSLWTHPEEVAEPAQIAVWREVIDYAAAARGRGLWVAPLVEIVERMRAIRRAELVLVPDGPATLMLVTNHGSTALGGLTIELGQTAAIQTGVVVDRRGDRLRLATLGAQEVVGLMMRPTGE